MCSIRTLWRIPPPRPTGQRHEAPVDQGAHLEGERAVEGLLERDERLGLGRAGAASRPYKK